MSEDTRMWPADVAPGGWLRRIVVAWTFVAIILLAMGGIWLFRTVLGYVFTFLIGGLLAFLLRPVVALLMRWKLSRGLAVLVTALLLVAVLVGVLVLLLPQISAEAQNFASMVPTYQKEFQSVVDKATAALPASAQSSLDQAQKQASDQSAQAIKSIAAGLASAAGSLVSIGFDLFLGFIIAIWFMLDGSAVQKWSLSVLPPAWRVDAAEVGATFDRSFGGFIRGSVINMSLMFTGMAIGFNVVGVPYAWGLAALCGLLGIIPIVGGITGGLIATLVALTVSPQLAIVTLVIVLVVEQLVDSVFSPIVMGSSVRLHPLAILFALAIGQALAGVFGMIVAIPAAAGIYTTYMYFARKYGMLEPADEAVIPEEAAEGASA